MARFALIVNQAARHSRQVVPQATAALDVAAASYLVSESASLDHAAQLAARAVAAGDVVVAVGGDGMAGTLAAACARHGGTLGIIPAGRGNDLARALRIPFDPASAVSALARGSARQIDLIGVTVPDGPEAVVAGSVYLGVPSVAGQIANQSRWLTGSLVYPAAALRALAGWQPAGFAVAGSRCQHDFAGYAIVVANSAYFGAGMKVAPQARVDDGVLDLVLMRHGPRLAFVRALAKIKDGSHTELAQISLDRDNEVTLTVDRPMPVAADGETLPFAAPLPAGTPLRVRVLPSALTVIAPPATD